MRVNDQQVTINVLEAMKSLDEVEYCHLVNAVELAVTDNLNNCCSNEEIKATTFKELEDEDVVAVHIAWLRNK